MARARELGATSIAFPALGTGVGGFPLDEGARITVETVRDELPSCPTIDARHLRPARRGRLRGLRARPSTSGQPAPAVAVVTTPMEPTEEQRDELVEQVAREIQLRGLTGAGRPLPRGQPAVPAARRQRDALLRPGAARRCSAARPPRRREILADDAGIEQLIARLEELDDEAIWDA